MRRLGGDDAAAIHSLVQDNKAHLTKHGDYFDMVAMSPEAWRKKLASPSHSELPMGIFVEAQPIGVATLRCHKRRILGLGYWIDAQSQGKGYVTQACRSLIDYARDACGANEVWVGVNPQNAPSIAVAKRVGLRLARTQQGHLSYMIKIGRKWALRRSGSPGLV